jgi:hypothetical protein
MWRRSDITLRGLTRSILIYDIEDTYCCLLPLPSCTPTPITYYPLLMGLADLKPIPNGHSLVYRKYRSSWVNRNVDILPPKWQ